MTLGRKLRLGLLALSLVVGLVACGGTSPNEVLAAQEPVMSDLQLDGANRRERYVLRGSSPLGNGPYRSPSVDQFYRPIGAEGLAIYIKAFDLGD